MDKDLFKIFRHRGAIPQYSYESDAKLEAVARLESENPNFLIGGNALDGIGIADRVKQGFSIANRVAEKV